MVLQGMNQADRLQTMIQRGIQRQPQELGIARGHGMGVCRAVDEVIGKVGATLGRLLDVVHG